MQTRTPHYCRVVLGALLVASPVAFAESAPPAPKPTTPAATAPVKPGPVEPTAHADLKDATGASVGEAAVEQTPHGLLVTLKITKLPVGVHAFHVHETGKCEAPFKTAGGHFNPHKAKHGILAAEGKHGGDLPNITVAADGTAHAQFFVPDLTLKHGEKTSLFDADGSAFVIHAAHDDYKTDPTGNAGDRVACGVVVENPMEKK